MCNVTQSEDLMGYVLVDGRRPNDRLINLHYYGRRQGISVLSRMFRRTGQFCFHETF